MNTAPPPSRTGSDPVRPSGSLAISEPPPPSRRRWVWVAVCGAVAVLAMLGVIATVNQVSDRERVLAVARDVPAGKKLTSADLVVAEVARDPALKPVSADRRGELVGQYATVGLRAGSLLTSRAVSGKNALAAGHQLVGVEAKRGQLPAKALAAGDTVQVISTPDKAAGESDKGGETEKSPIDGTVTDVSSPDASGAVVVNLAVSQVDGPLLAARAAGGDVAIVRQPAGS
jgi:hypothetical protein